MTFVSLQWLCQESPEFMDLYLDCKSKLKEDKNILSPLVQSARTSALPVTAEVKYNLHV